MIPVILLGGVEPVSATSPTGGGRGEAQRLLPQLEPGQLVSARIDARLPDGSFKVEVAGQPLRMVLPDYLSPGDTLELTFIAREPRPTFSLREALTQSNPAPALSAAGRLVAAIMPPAGEPNLPLPPSSTAPLLAALPVDGSGLSASLQQSLAQSGLFYEAHQAEWVAGKRELTQLRLEPQAKIASGAGQAAPAAGAMLPAPASGASVAVAGGASAPAAGPHSGETVQTPGLPLVQQQLGALESGRVLLQLEVWPRQWMQWEIEEQAPDAAHAQDAPSEWRTQLRLDLPQLGALHAALTLGRDGVRIRLDTASAGSASLLQDNLASLRASLAGAGVAPAAIAVSRHEQA
jgi:flagellar hook-length control protein FliK